ncbi:MAG: tetratricopeptide repeat protein [Chitinophagaceae bacterium]
MRRMLTLTLALSFLFANAQERYNGQELLLMQQYEGARQYFQQQLKQNAENEEAWLGLTRAMIAQSNPEKALEELNKAPEKTQESHLFRIAKAGALLALNRNAEADVLFQYSIDNTKSKNAEVLKSIARWHVELDNVDASAALPLLENAARRAKKDAEIYYLEGKAYRKLHKGTEAYQAFQEALDRDGDFAAAYYELGRIFQTQKNADVYTDYFTRAIKAEPGFAPALYEMYEHHLYQSPEKAREYFLAYRQQADPDIQQEYEYTDLLYLNKNYDSAVLAAKQIIDKEAGKAKARLYKLMAYSLQELNDTAKAIAFMKQYFQREVDSNLIAKDFETMGQLYSSSFGQLDSAIHYYALAVEKTEVKEQRLNYFRQLAALGKQSGNPATEAKWLGRYYLADPDASNVTLFNWGLAAYKAEDFVQADSVFAMYASKYPEQGYGYYWRARANAAIDTSMEAGLAVPHYQQLAGMLNKTPDSLSTSDKKWLVEANMYLASYATNTQKDYPAAVEYFKKVVELDPDNTTAPQYIEILEKTIQASAAAGSKSESGQTEEEEKGESSSVPER